MNTLQRNHKSILNTSLFYLWYSFNDKKYFLHKSLSFRNTRVIFIYRLFIFLYQKFAKRYLLYLNLLWCDCHSLFSNVIMEFKKIILIRVHFRSFRKILVQMHPFKSSVGTWTQSSKIMAWYKGFGNLASTFLRAILHLNIVLISVRSHKVTPNRSWIYWQSTYNSSNENNMEFTAPQNTTSKFQISLLNCKSLSTTMENYIHMYYFFVTKVKELKLDYINRKLLREIKPLTFSCSYLCLASND